MYIIIHIVCLLARVALMLVRSAPRLFSQKIKILPYRCTARDRSTVYETLDVAYVDGLLSGDLFVVQKKEIREYSEIHFPPSNLLNYEQITDRMQESPAISLVISLSVYRALLPVGTYPTLKQIGMDKFTVNYCHSLGSWITDLNASLHSCFLFITSISQEKIKISHSQPGFCTTIPG